MKNEVWKDVPNYEGLYQVSNYGRLKSLEKSVKFYSGYAKKICERNIDGATYIYINVWNRKILFRQDKSLDKECLNTLYDLIKADLIEKVDDK